MDNFFPKSLLYIALFIGFISIVALINDKYTPVKSIDEMRAEQYYRCVNTQYVNGRDIANCNQIK